MSFASVMLRLLLCLALAVNGVSTARAGMHLEHGAASGAGQAAAAEATGDMAGMPCHEMGRGDVAGPSQAPDSGSDSGKAATPDCCKGGCQCACMHATPALATAAFPALVVRAAAQRRGMTVHASPSASRLNRPPIG